MKFDVGRRNYVEESESLRGKNESSGSESERWEK